MKLFKKCAAVLLTAMLASSLFLGCPDDETDDKEPPKDLVVVFSPKAGVVEKGAKISLSCKDKETVIYYELVAEGGTATLTVDNFETVGTEYKGSFTSFAGTVYAVVTKNGKARSEVMSAKYKLPVVPTDSDFEKLHSLIMPSGTGATIPAWNKTDSTYTLPEVVTGFTTAESKYTELNMKTNRTKVLADAIDDANAKNFFADKKVKNVIVVFADGWGEGHNLGAREFYGDVYKDVGGVEGLIMDHLPYHAPINHDSYPKANSDEKNTWTYDAANNDWNISDFKLGTKSGFDTTDSTAGGSAINTGFTTYYSACDVDIKGTEVRSILELAREKGMLVGNVTNDWLTDATPATVGIHSPKRKDSVLINGRMYVNSPDWTMGNGGFTDWVGQPSALKTPFKHHDYAAQDPGHLEQWFTANTTGTAKGRLQEWAKLLLKEYDGKDIDPATYSIADNWTTDRKLKTYSTFKSAIEAIDADKSIRPLVSFSKSHDFDYDPKGYDKKTGKYYGAPCFGYKLGYGQRDGETVFPNFAEMVASTLYALDTKAKAQGDRGFFAFIENTCNDGWGHAVRQYDCINEAVIDDEGIAIAAKYVLENPDTLLVITADHETGGVQFESGWDVNSKTEGYKKVYARGGGGHSSQPIPVFAFGAGAENWDDVPAFDMSKWTADEKAAYVKGTPYPHAKDWTDPFSAQPSDPKFPKILRNNTTGIRIGKAMGFKNFGDLNGNGVLDPDTEADSVMDYTKVGTFNKQ